MPCLPAAYLEVFPSCSHNMSKGCSLLSLSLGLSFLQQCRNKLNEVVKFLFCFQNWVCKTIKHRGVCRNLMWTSLFFSSSAAATNQVWGRFLFKQFSDLMSSNVFFKIFKSDLCLFPVRQPKLHHMQETWCHIGGVTSQFLHQHTPPQNTDFNIRIITESWKHLKKFAVQKVIFISIFRKWKLCPVRDNSFFFMTLSWLASCCLRPRLLWGDWCSWLRGEGQDKEGEGRFFTSEERRGRTWLQRDRNKH